MTALADLPTLPGHTPHFRATRRYHYLICSCGWDTRTKVGLGLPWFLWQRHLDEVQEVGA